MASDQSVKDQVFAAVKRDLSKFGTPAWDKGAILRPFFAHAARSSLYRWVDEAVAEYRPGAEVVRATRRAQAKAAKVEAAADTTEKALAAAVLPSADEIVGSAMSVSQLIKRLEACMTAAEQVMAHARTPEGGVRMSKTLLAAAENLRRGVEAAIKLQQTLLESGETDRFRREIIETMRAVGREYPEAGKLLATRLQAVAGQWR